MAATGEEKSMTLASIELIYEMLSIVLLASVVFVIDGCRWSVVTILGLSKQHIRSGDGMYIGYLMDIEDGRVNGVLKKRSRWDRYR